LLIGVGSGLGKGYDKWMQTKIEKIGDRFGLLLPKELLEACGFGADAIVTIQNKTLIVTPGPHRPREGWTEALEAIPQDALNKDAAELKAFRETPDEWDATEWQWPDINAHEKI